MYDPFSARWTAVDPMAMSTPYSSPFSYCIGDPVNCYDPFGLTTYDIDGRLHIIDDGSNEWIRVSQTQFNRLNRIWNQGLGEKYDSARQSIKDTNGYTDSDGNQVLAAASVTTQSAPILLLASTVALVSVDLSVPDLTDVAPPKWFAYAGILSAAEVANLLAKQGREVSKLERRSDGPQGVQYSLRATHSGMYPNVRGGLVYLEEGEVWKYGETIQQPPEARYGGVKAIERMGLWMHYDTPGSQKQIKIAEKYKLYDYYIHNGHLPPGNSIFR